MTLRRATAVVLVSMLVSGGVLCFTGCEQKGPVERAGEKIDRAVEDMKDKIDPPSPAEKVGRAIDRAVDDVTK
jgi:tRNA A37 threonylcarbamoyltransferase TsaD